MIYPDNLPDYLSVSYDYESVKKLKGSNVFIYKDFCFESMQSRQELGEEVTGLKSEDQIAILNYRSIVVKGRRDSGD